MDLNLTVIRYKTLPPQQVLSANIGSAGGTIGRNPDNNLVLRDPERWVSGQHAKIHFHDGAFYLTDTSKNGTFVNNAAEPLQRGQDAELSDGDKLSIGGYEVRVSLSAEEPQPARPFDPFAGSEPVSESFDELSSGEAAPDILDLVGPDHVGQEPSFPWEQQQTAPSEPHDWLAADSSEGEPWSPGGPPEPSEAPESTAEPDHTPDANAFFSPPNALLENYDILADESHLEQSHRGDAAAGPDLLGTSPGSPGADANKAQAGKSDDLSGMPAKPAIPAAGGEIRALRAFLEGLGAGEPPSDPAAQAQLMHTAGMLLRTMTEGLMQVMMARTRFKSELRLEMTSIRSTENNPFKFSVAAEDALDHLLFRPGRGFLPPRDAAQEAFSDIQRHEMAIFAGLRAAVRALLARLDPAELERGFRDRSVFDNLMPLARKAKYWDLFTEKYDQVAADAAEDFLQLFGDAFTRAYEAQTDRLKQPDSFKNPSDEP